MRDKEYQGAADWEAVRRLLLACQGSVPVDMARYPTLWRLRILMTTRLRTPQRDAHLWRDDRGDVIGFAALFRRPHRDDQCELGYFVHPHYRGTDAAAAALTWAIARATEMADDLNGSVECWGDASGQQPTDAALLEHAGFARLEPYVQYMETALTGPHPEAPLPESFTLRTLDDGVALDAYLALYNAVSSPLDREHKEALMLLPEYDPTLDIVVMAPDGSPAAFCEASYGRDAWADGRKVGWIDHMGTHPLYQRRGLGEAVMTAGLHRLREVGATMAALFTASRNAPAQRLYARLGFQPGATALLFEQRVTQCQEVSSQGS